MGLVCGTPTSSMSAAGARTAQGTTITPAFMAGVNKNPFLHKYKVCAVDCISKTSSFSQDVVLDKANSFFISTKIKHKTDSTCTRELDLQFVLLSHLYQISAVYCQFQIFLTANQNY